MGNNRPSIPILLENISKEVQIFSANGGKVRFSTITKGGSVTF